MCQLLGMNCNVPTDIVFSFTGFQQRGGNTDHHADGWGIAFFEGRGCRLFLDSAAASSSPVAQLVRTYPIRSTNVIAHIRKATRGAVALENTHPFMRELWGRYWIFAHNGTLDAIAAPADGRFRPVGGTDSEAAFCTLLDALWRRFGDTQPGEAALRDAVAEWARRMRNLGSFNFLLSNGERLFAHCATQLAYIVRQAPFSRARLSDAEVEVDFSELTTPADRVAVVATLPLTENETWTVMQPGQLACFVDGAPVVA